MAKRPSSQLRFAACIVDILGYVYSNFFVGFLRVPFGKIGEP